MVVADLDQNIYKGPTIKLAGGVMVFCFPEIFFRTAQELEYIFILSRKARFFPQNLTLGYITKTLNQIIIFFPPPKSEYFFQQHWESEYFFRKKTFNALTASIKSLI